MSNHLSFAQILQKKKSNTSTANSRIITNTPPNQLFFSKPPQNYPQHIQSQSKPQQFPTLSQMMNQYAQFPNDPQENFILSFREIQQHQYGIGSQFQNSQDFEVGVNPLDSFIMSKGYLNSNKNKNKPKGHPILAANKNIKIGNKQSTLIDLGKRFMMAKENNNLNSKASNYGDAYKYSSKTYRESSQRQSMEGSQQLIEDSRRYGPTSPSAYSRTTNKQMFVNTKIIQSQAYQNDDMKKSKNSNINLNINIPKIERSQKIDGKLSRYQINYQETERKEEPEPTKQQQSKMIQSKNQQYMMGSQNRSKSPIQLKTKITKKQSQQQSLLIENEQQMASKARKQPQQPQRQEQSYPNTKQIPILQKQTSNQKRIQDAKKQINQYLQIREKVQPKNVSQIPVKPIEDMKPTFIKNKVTSIIDKIIQNTQVCQTKVPANVNYSFANQVPIAQNMTKNAVEDSFSGVPITRKQLQQIEEENKFFQSQRMLSCIEYTNSEADVYDIDDAHQKEQEQSILLEIKKNKQARQSIPDNRQKNIESHQTLQKYLPKNSQKKACSNMFNLTQDIIPKQLQMNEPVQKSSEAEYSEMIEKIAVQPSIQNMKKQNKALEISGTLPLRFMKEVQIQDGGCNDASSIDIQISDNSSQLYLTNQLNSAQKYPGIFKKPSVESQKLYIPQLNLNISDIQSVSNISHQQSSQKKTPLLKLSAKKDPSYNFQCQQVESNVPLSSNQSLNIHKHESSHGFIYRMRIGSRNSSFTSDYNYGAVIHDNNPKDQSHNFGGSNHSSLNIKQQKSYNQQDSQQQINDSNNVNMTKNNQCMEVSISIQNSNQNMQPTYKSKQQPYLSQEDSSSYRRQDSCMEMPVVTQCVQNNNRQYSEPVDRVPYEYQDRFTVQSISINLEQSFQNKSNVPITINVEFQKKQSETKQVSEQIAEEDVVMVIEEQVPLSLQHEEVHEITQTPTYKEQKIQVGYQQIKQKQPEFYEQELIKTPATPDIQQVLIPESQKQFVQQSFIEQNQFSKQAEVNKEVQESKYVQQNKYIEENKQIEVLLQKKQEVSHTQQILSEPNLVSQVITIQRTDFNGAETVPSYIHQSISTPQLLIAEQVVPITEIYIKDQAIIEQKQIPIYSPPEQQKQETIIINEVKPVVQQHNIQELVPTTIVTPVLIETNTIPKEQSIKQIKTNLATSITNNRIKSSLRNSINLQNKENKDDEPFQFDLDF